MAGENKRQGKAREASPDPSTYDSENYEAQIDDPSVWDPVEAQLAELQQLREERDVLRSELKTMRAVENDPMYKDLLAMSQEHSEMEQTPLEQTLPDELITGTGLDTSEYSPSLKLRRGPLLRQLPEDHWLKIHWENTKIALFQSLWLGGVSAASCPAIGPHAVSVPGFATKPDFPSIRLGAYVPDNITEEEQKLIKKATKDYMRMHWGRHMALTFPSATRFKAYDDEEISTEKWYKHPGVCLKDEY